MKNLILGLDVSTSCTGICLIDPSFDEDVSTAMGKHILELDKIDLSKIKTFWEKVDRVKLDLLLLRQKYPQGIDVAVEEPLLGFRTGASSASTIAMLLKFNGIVSYLARSIFTSEPLYVSATHARKVCGIKIQRTSACGISAKEQVFAHMMLHDLQHVNWPVSKTNKVVPWSRDATDAYCIARSVMIEFVNK